MRPDTMEMEVDGQPEIVLTPRGVVKVVFCTAFHESDPIPRGRASRVVDLALELAQGRGFCREDVLALRESFARLNSSDIEEELIERFLAVVPAAEFVCLLGLPGQAPPTRH